jgi:hypothetical protein
MKDTQKQNCGTFLHKLVKMSKKLHYQIIWDYMTLILIPTNTSHLRHVQTIRIYHVGVTVILLEHKLISKHQHASLCI